MTAFIGLQYLVHTGDKCIRSLFRYLRQPNGHLTVSILHFSLIYQNLEPIFVRPKAITDMIKGLYSPLDWYRYNTMSFCLLNYLIQYCP